jgi:hypothetical protein
MAGGLIGQRRDVQAAKGHVAAAPAIVVSELVGAVRRGDVDRHDHQVRPIIGGERHDMLVLEHDLVLVVEVPASAASPSGGNSAYLIGRNPGSLASSNAGRISLTITGPASQQHREPAG